MLPRETYVRRRKALVEKMAGEQGVLLFIGNVESPAQYRDNCYKWRQDSTWLYFFGIDEPRFAATIDLESGEVRGSIGSYRVREFDAGDNYKCAVCTAAPDLRESELVWVEL